MNIFDFILIAVFILAIIKGLAHGLIIELTSTACIIAGVLLARAIAPMVAPKFMEWLSCTDYIATPIAYITVFILIVLVCRLAGHIIDKGVDKSMLSGANKALGAAVSLLKYAIAASLMINLLHAVNNKANLFNKSRESDSLLYNPVRKVMPALMPFIEETDFENISDWTKEDASNEEEEEQD